MNKFRLPYISLPLLLLRLVALGLAQAAPPAAAPPMEDPRGPVDTWVGQTKVDDEGVQAVRNNFKLTTGEAPWSPAWVWAQDDRDKDHAAIAAHFRKEFLLPAGTNVTGTVARVSADCAFRLWVNAKLVLRGPDDPGSDVAGPVKWSHQWLFSQVDLAPFLHVGQNIIAAEVFRCGWISGFSLDKPGFAFEATIASAGKSPIVISTADRWSAEASRAYSEGPIPSATGPDQSGLLYDARLDSPRWREPSFQDRAWKVAMPVDSVWGPLIASQIPVAMEAIWPAHSTVRATPNVTTAAPLDQVGKEIHISGNGTFSVQYDRVLSGYISMKVRGPKGAVVTIEPVETLTDPHPMRVAQVTLRQGESIFEYPAYDSFSAVKITVSKARGPLVFEDVRATFVSQPVTYRGSFQSSDDNLNRLWISARWLTQICMQNRYLDSPHNQEPLGDPGDYLIESMQSNYAFGEPWLARQDLQKFAAMLDHSGQANFHTSYALLWLQMLLDYYDYTGDEVLLRQLAPAAHRLLDHFSKYQGANGLLSEAPNYMFMDWVTIQGFNGHHPPAVIGQGYLTAFYYQALANGARLATLLGDDPRRLKYEQFRRTVLAAFQRELWDEKAGLYRDGKPHMNHQPIDRWLPEDTEIVTHTPQLNALAVLYDLAPRERQPAILEKLFSTAPLNVQPYFMHFVLQAEAHAGVFDQYAWTQMQRWHLDPETRTFGEDWNAGDHSHAWGGTPLIQMSAQILGVTPAEAGYRRVAIRPHLCGLEWAKGVVPTPAGDVMVAWTNKESVFTLETTTPNNMQAEVMLPGIESAGAMVIDGKQVSLTAIGPDQVLVLPGGTHKMSLQGAAPSI